MVMWQALKRIIKIFNSSFLKQTNDTELYTTYDKHAVIFQEISTRLLERLAVIRIQPQIIVELGASTGILTSLLNRAFPDAQLLAIDQSQAALAYANKKKRVTNKLVSAICSNSSQLPVPEHTADLIIANLVPLWCDNLPAMLKEIKRVLKPGGLVICSSLGPDTLKELDGYLQQSIRLPIHDKLIDMHIVGDELMHAGFTEPVMEMEFQQVIYPNLHELIQELRTLRLLAQSDIIVSTSQDKAMLTFEIIYGHAWQPIHASQHKSESGEIYIPADKIKRLNKS